MSYSISYNPEQNSIIIKVFKIDEINADQYMKDLTDVLEQAKPDFCGYTDVTESPILYPEVVGKLAPAMDLALSKGLSTSKKWGFVTDNPIHKMQWRHMYKDKVEYFETCAEADAYLKQN